MPLKRPVTVAGNPAKLERSLEFEVARITEHAAIAAARFRGAGNEQAADRAAVLAMRTDLHRLAVDGMIVIGEGAHDQVDMLYVGERIGQRRGAQRVDIALAPVEGVTLCAKNLPNSVSVVALALEGGFLPAPDVYMDKIAIGPGYPEGVIDLDRTPAANLAALAEAKGVSVSALTVAILDRPRHQRLIATVRETGANVRLLRDGDVAAVIHAAMPDVTGIDVYLGIGRAPEAVLAAAALAALGGQIQTRFVLEGAHQSALLLRAGISDPRAKFRVQDLAKGDILFAATGITDGDALKGVQFDSTELRTETLVTRSSTHTRRLITSSHALDRTAPE